MSTSFRCVAVLAAGVTLLLSACGGGGGGGSSSGPPPPNPLFVRGSVGSDSNSGADPNNALKTITKAAQLALNGYKVIVGPGTYVEGVNPARLGTTPQALMFVADATGQETGDNAGQVLIDATNSAAAAGFDLSSSPGSVIDGFTITGATDAGIVIKSRSDDFTIQNCIVFDNPGDGIRVQDSRSALVFNNLVYSNGGVGISIVGTLTGSDNARVYSNTAVGNGNRGITIGNSKAGSTGAVVHNNILQANSTTANPAVENIKVFTNSQFEFDGDFNAVFPPTYNPANGIKGQNDFSGDAQFKNAGRDDFHLLTTSPLIDRGGALAGLPNSEAQILRERTTTGIALDSGVLDMGFHFLRAQ